MDAANRAPRRTSDVKIDAARYPGWINGTERPPAAGERVFTHEGPGVVLRVLGRTSAAGRLLEVSMDDGRKPLFFTADGNVMVERNGSPVAPVQSGSGTA